MRVALLIGGAFAALPSVFAAQPATCTSATMIAPAPSGYVCGQSGALKMPQILESHTNTDQDGCGDACFALSSCKSYGYNSANSTCQLYSKSLYYQDYIKDQSSGFTYWSVNCLACAEMTSAATTIYSTTASSPVKSSTSSKSTTSTSISSKSTTSKSTTSKSTTSKSTTSKSTTSKSTSSKTTKSTTTSKSSSTAKSTSSSTSASTCTSTSVSENGVPYSRYYVGSGVTLSTNNPGNDNSAEPPITNSMNQAFSSDCDAIKACIDYALQDPYTYYSFDLHYLKSTQTWVCVQYYDHNMNTTFWNVTNSDVTIAYGFYNPDF